MIPTDPPERADGRSSVPLRAEDAALAAPSAAAPSTADRAFLQATLAWGGPFSPSFWDRFPLASRELLRDFARELRSEASTAASNQAALRRVHVAQARPDVRHVHPSWWVRALKDESPAVRRAVAAHADPSVRSFLQRSLGLEPRDLEPDHPANPEALGWTLGLWTERIVGDQPGCPEDPPIVIALTGLSSGEAVDLLRTSGLARRALAASEPPPLGPLSRARFDDFRRTWRNADPVSRSQARRDCRQFLLARNRSRGWGRLGLLTFGRLLSRVEPYRVRWTLQHLPYGIARLIRPSIKPPGDVLEMLESTLLRVAWDRLVVEGRIRAPGDLTHGR